MEKKQTPSSCSFQNDVHSQRSQHDDIYRKKIIHVVDSEGTSPTRDIKVVKQATSQLHALKDIKEEAKALYEEIKKNITSHIIQPLDQFDQRISDYEIQFNKYLQEAERVQENMSNDNDASALKSKMLSIQEACNICMKQTNESMSTLICNLSSYEIDKHVTNLLKYIADTLEIDTEVHTISCSNDESPKIVKEKLPAKPKQYKCTTNDSSENHKLSHKKSKILALTENEESKAIEPKAKASDIGDSEVKDDSIKSLGSKESSHLVKDMEESKDLASAKRTINFYEIIMTSPTVDKALMHIANLNATRMKFKNVILENVRVYDKDFKRFLAVLEKVECHSIIFCNVKATSKQWKRIAEAITINSSVRALCLRKLQIECIHDWDCLRHSQVQSLSLNSVTMKALLCFKWGEVFSFITNNNPNITALSYINCNLDDNCASDIKDALSKNKYLKQLDLSNNLISRTGYKVIMKYNNKSHILSKLIMNGNPCASSNK